MISGNIGRGPKFERAGRGPIFLVLVFGLWGPLNCSLPEKPKKGDLRERTD